jgi:hypothetical protein
MVSTLSKKDRYKLNLSKYNRRILILCQILILKFYMKL